MQLKDIPLSKILVSEDRSREVDEDYALAIQTEMVAGTFFDPILVRPTPRAARPYTLVDGGHRLRGVELNGETEITCLVIEADAAEAERIEVAANLFRHELTPLDRAISVQIYRRAWEKKHGKIARGGDRTANLAVCPADTLAEEAERGFAASCAERLGFSKRAIERSQQIALGLPNGLQRALRKTPAAHNQQTLLSLAKLEPKKKDQLTIALKNTGDLDEALRAVEHKPKSETVQPNRQKQELGRLVDAWERAGEDARREFLDLIGAAIRKPREKMPSLTEIVSEVEGGGGPDPRQITIFDAISQAERGAA